MIRALAATLLLAALAGCGVDGEPVAPPPKAGQPLLPPPPPASAGCKDGAQLCPAHD